MLTKNKKKVWSLANNCNLILYVPEQLGWFWPFLPAVQDVCPPGVFSLFPLHSCDDDPFVQCFSFTAWAGIVDNEVPSIITVATTATVTHVIFMLFIWSHNCRS